MAGTAMWHLRHTLEIFRIHCAAATHGEVRCDGDIPQDASAVRDMLLGHIDDFIGLARKQPPRRLAKSIFYGEQVTMPEMLGIMTRHITWHSAAIHYWIKWKADEADESPRPPTEFDDDC